VVALPFAPNAAAAFTLLVVRALLSNMDVPARSSYVMAIVTPAERAAAAGVTNVPRSLATALSPTLAGALIGAGLFARYNLVGSLTAAAGALSVGILQPLGRVSGLSALALMEGAFVLYGVLAIPAFLLYRRLPDEPADAAALRTPLGPSRRHVYALAALFSLDSFGSGFFVQSLLALWLFDRFGLSLAAAGGFFFWTGVLTALSQLAAPPLARRIGLIRTMVFTHIPACLCVVALAFAPNAITAFVLLVVRALLSNMDVPARSSYVMAIVTPPERAAAAAVTNVPRSLASAFSPALAGLIFSLSPFAWPLVIGGALKVAYDLLLLWRFRHVRPPEESDAVGAPAPPGR
jgi:predicted MFS family arabinose efflux permease